MRAAATDLHDGQGQHRRLMVCGDLNDVPEAATTQILSGPPGSEIGTNGFDQPDRGDGQRLRNLPHSEQQRFSRRYQGEQDCGFLRADPRCANSPDDSPVYAHALPAHLTP